MENNKKSKDEQYAILEKFFAECVRFWEHELKISSDTDKSAYINAIKEIPSTNPYKYKESDKFDEDVVANFKKHRLMDCYGKDWERMAKSI